MEENPFRQFVEPRSGEDRNPFLQFLPQETAPAAQAPAQQQRQKNRPGGGFFGLPESAFSPGAFARGAAGGTAGLVGGAMELAPGAVGRAGAAVSRFGQEQVREAMEQQPGSGFVGSLAPALLPIGRALQAPTLAGRIGRGSAVGLGLGAAAPTGEEEYAERLPGKTLGAALGLGFGAGIPGIVGAGQQAAKLVQRARGRGVQEAGGTLASEAETAGQRVVSEAAEREAAARAALEAQLSGTAQRGQLGGAPFGRPSTVAELGERQTAAAGAGEAAAGRERLAGRGLAGVRQEEAFGQFGLAPRTLSEVGDYVRTNATKFIESLKEARRLRADREINAARTSAAAREGAEPFILSDDMLALADNIKQKLATETDSRVVQQLREIERALFTGTREATPSFASSETVRRRLGDAAFGVPAEGYEAIGQNLARELYGALSGAMRKYEPQFGAYLDNYRRLSQPLEVAGTRLGRAIMGTERDAPGFFAATSEQIANQAFRSPESVRALVAAFGNNRQLVNAAAERYFANQLTGKTAAEVRSILSSDRNRAVLRELGPEFAARLNERIVQRASVQAQRGTAAGQRAERLGREISETNKAIKGIEQQIARVTPQEPGVQAALDNLRAALNNEQRNQVASQLIKQLEGRVSPAERANLNKLVDDLKIAYEQQSRARRLLLGSAAAIGVPTAFGGKIMGYLGGP